MSAQLAALCRLLQPPPASISLTDNATDNTDASTYTFSARAIGAAHASRVVIVAGVFATTSGTAAVSSVTIGGYTATQLVAADNQNSGVSRLVSIWAARVPVGTTATVVFNLSGTAVRAGLGVWRAINIQDVAANAVAASDTSNGSPSSASITVPSGSVAVGATFANDVGTLATWSGLTIDFEQNLEAVNSMSAASATFQSSKSPTITVTWGGGVTQRCLALAAIR